MLNDNRPPTHGYGNPYDRLELKMDLQELIAVSVIKMFPVTAKQLQALSSNEPTYISNDFRLCIIYNRIRNEVFKSASEGKKAYTCDVMNDDTGKLLELLFQDFHCSTTVTPLEDGMCNLLIDWMD
jgi:hypothetical protein